MSCSTIQKGTEVCFGIPYSPTALTGYLLQDVTVSFGAQEKKIMNASGNTVTVINYDASKTVSLDAVILSATTPSFAIGDSFTLANGDIYRITKIDLKYQAGSECRLGLEGESNCGVTLS